MAEGNNTQQQQQEQANIRGQLDAIDVMEDHAAVLMELQVRKARLSVIAEMIKMFS